MARVRHRRHSDGFRRPADPTTTGTVRDDRCRRVFRSTGAHTARATAREIGGISLAEEWPESGYGDHRTSCIGLGLSDVGAAPVEISSFCQRDSCRPPSTCSRPLTLRSRQFLAACPWLVPLEHEPPSLNGVHISSRAALLGSRQPGGFSAAAREMVTQGHASDLRAGFGTERKDLVPLVVRVFHVRIFHVNNCMFFIYIQSRSHFISFATPVCQVSLLRHILP